VRSPAGLALLCAACAGGTAARPPAGPAPAAARALTYTAGTTRYRSASHQHIQRRLGDRDQATDAALLAYVSATLTRDGTGLQVAFTVDSVPEYVTGGPGSVGTSAALGATFTGTLAPDGSIANLSGGDSSVRLLAQLGDEIGHFYPRLPAGGISPGARWTDTTKTTTSRGGVPLTMTTVSEHLVGTPRDTLGGALPIETHTTYSFAGTGSQAGEAFSVQGAGAGRSVALLGLAGRFLGLTAADSSSYTIALKAADLTIPAHQTRADTVSVVP